MGRIIQSGMKLSAARLNALGNAQYISGVGPVSPGLTKSDTAFSTMTGLVMSNFTKYVPESGLEFDLDISCFSGSVGASTPKFGVLINGTDYEIMGHLINPSGTHLQFAGKRVVNGIPAGIYTVSVRWRRTGTGTLTFDTGDDYSLSVRECSSP